MSVRGTLSKMFGAIEQVGGDLDAIRAEVEKLKADIEREAARPVPLDVVEKRIAATVEALADEVARRVPIERLTAADGGAIIQTPALGGLPSIAVVAACQPAVMTAWLRTQAIMDLERRDEPVDASTRAKRLGELRRKLHDVESHEAETLWAAAERGVTLPWRSDLSPAALLGLEPA